MKKIKSIAMMALLLFAGATISYAHGDKGPHGGQIVASGNYYVELLNKEGKITVYLLDANEKTMGNKSITGKAVLQFADKTSATIKLTPNGDDKYNIEREKSAKFTSCEISLVVNGKTIKANFLAIAEVKKTPSPQPHNHNHGEDGHKH